MNYCTHIAAESQLNTGVLIEKLGISRSKFFDWRQRLGIANNHNGAIPKAHWTTPEETQAVINYARKHMSGNAFYLKDGYRRIAYMGLDEDIFALSPTTVYRILKKAGLLNKWHNRSSHKGQGYIQPKKPHQEWHTDIKYVNYHGAFLFFIGVMDGYSRYILHHELRAQMTELDIEITVQRAHEKYPDAKPKLISDNGSQFIANEFKSYLKEIGLRHVKISPSYPQSNGKIERFHRTLEEECLRIKSLINMDDAEKQIAAYVDHYNEHRLHSALSYLRPVDYFKGNVDELLGIRQAKLDAATASRNTYWSEKKLDNAMKNHKFDISDEAETGSAGAQLVRNNPTDWNGRGVGDEPTSLNQIIPVINA